MFSRPKRPGGKYHGRIIRITHPDGKTEAHLLPPVAVYRDLSLAQIEYEHFDNECMCEAHRLRLRKRLSDFKLIGAIKAAYYGFVRFIYG